MRRWPAGLSDPGLSESQRNDLVIRTVIAVYRATVDEDCGALADATRRLRESGDLAAHTWVSTLLADLVPSLALPA